MPTRRTVLSRYVTDDYWITRTGLGLSFGAATLLGLLA